MHRIAVLAAGALLAAAPLTAQQDFHWSGALAAGKTLEIKGINGPIHAVRASGGTALVTATKRARKSNPDEVEIKVEEHSDGVTICAIYPSRHGSRQEGCSPSNGDRGQTRDNDVEITFQVQVPDGVDLVAGTVNGQVDARDLASDARVSTVNGDVEVETSGEAEASTVNGSIRAELGRSSGSGRLEFTTVNGGITVTLPATLGAELEASTVNGSIDSDFPVTMQGRMSAKTLRGTIGGGGRRLELTTVNGSIHIRKG
jgi:DUF4097 and DUF4098 domain-containing protein YvlB